MKYISIETGKGTADSVYKWGQKAEQEVSKLELLKFVAMVRIYSFYVHVFHVFFFFVV